jgi:hypothetical protein
MCQNEGIIKPSVHPLGGFDDDAALVIERDDHVLDRLRREGKLTMNMVVVTSGK